MGLGPEDAGALATRVREQMLDALREISIRATGSSRLEIPQRVQPPKTIPEPSLVVQTASPRISEPDQMLPSSASTSSLADSLTSSRYQMSENGAETEEDEGMVLVGRPS